MSSQAPPSALERELELELIVKGRRSGKNIPRPVWFVNRGGTILLLPVDGSATNWYKNILKNPEVTIRIVNHRFGAKVKPITDAKRVHEVVQLFEKRYGKEEIQKWYTKLDVAAEVPLHRGHSK